MLAPTHARMSKRIDRIILEISAVSTQLGFPVPRKLLIAGANTFSHLKEAAPLLGDISPPIDPMILGKATSSIAGPFDDMASAGNH
jgi:hypothetical protein